MATLKDYVTAKVVVFVARHCTEYMSDTGKLLAMSVASAEPGSMPYPMRDTINKWMSATDTWVDRFVLSYLLAEDTKFRVRGIVLQNVTNGWKESDAVSAAGEMKYESPLQKVLFNDSSGNV